MNLNAHTRCARNAIWRSWILVEVGNGAGAMYNLAIPFITIYFHAYILVVDAYYITNGLI